MLSTIKLELKKSTRWRPSLAIKSSGNERGKRCPWLTIESLDYSLELIDIFYLPLVHLIEVLHRLQLYVKIYWIKFVKVDEKLHYLHRLLAPVGGKQFYAIFSKRLNK